MNLWPYLIYIKIFFLSHLYTQHGAQIQVSYSTDWASQVPPWICDFNETYRECCPPWTVPVTHASKYPIFSYFITVINQHFWALGEYIYRMKPTDTEGIFAAP